MFEHGHEMYFCQNLGLDTEGLVNTVSKLMADKPFQSDQVNSIHLTLFGFLLFFLGYRFYSTWLSNGFMIWMIIEGLLTVINLKENIDYL